MDAGPLLNLVVASLAEVKLEVILIGNAAAALHGAPVTTLDFDFMFRHTTVNLAKLKRFAKRLDAVILRPYYPMSQLYRVMNDDRGLQADFMPAIHGVKSFNSFAAARGENQSGRTSPVDCEPGRHHCQQTRGRTVAGQSRAGNSGKNIA